MLSTNQYCLPIFPASLVFPQVNGVEVLNLQHLHQLLMAARLQWAKGDAEGELSLELEMSDSRLLVMSVGPALACNQQLLNLHRIPSDTSADLLGQEAKPC